MPDSRLLTERQVRRMEQLVKGRKLPSASGPQPIAPIARRAGVLQRPSRERVTSSRIKTVQSYLQLYG